MILIDMGAIEKKENTALEIYNTKPGTKAIEVRRRMVQLPEVAKALNPVEKYVFAASTIPNIRDTFDAILQEKGFIKGIIFDMNVQFAVSQKPGDRSRYPVVTIVPNESEGNLFAVKEAFKPVQLLE